MSRTKERRKIIHEPSTHEIFICLCGMPIYSKILVEQMPDKPYSEFLRWVIGKNFFNERTEKILIKKIASDFKADTAKVTKWIKEIYEEIFELNFNKPELFQNEGIKVSLLMKHHDNSCNIDTSMPVLPREFELIRFPFVKAKIGTEYFWVKRVEHEIVENNTTITLWLEGGFLNKYRELALDKAIFQGRIHFMDVYHKSEFELDDEIKKIYRN